MIAEVYDEGGVIVAQRIVTEGCHLLWKWDAWPLGRQALDQALDMDVDLLRYVAPEGTYEIAVAAFVEQAERLPFRHETQFALRRRAWRFTPHEAAASTEAPKARVHTSSDMAKNLKPEQLPLFPKDSATG